jgi:hypothetical protein
MHIARTTDYAANGPELKRTLWHCEKCGSFVSIHCARVVHEARCPTCTGASLEFCGTFDVILEGRFADA